MEGQYNYKENIIYKTVFITDTHCSVGQAENDMETISVDAKSF